MLFRSVHVTGYRSIENSGEVPLGPITVLIGRNNSGKSALIRAIYLLQSGAPFRSSDIRFGHPQVEITLNAVGSIPFKSGGGGRLGPEFNGGQVRAVMNKNANLTLAAAGGNLTTNLSQAFHEEPGNLIYPVLSGRKPISYVQPLSRSNTRTVSADDSYLVNRISDLLAAPEIPEAQRFRDLCTRVLGIRFSVISGENSQLLGVRINRFEEILLEAMGAGLSAALNLLASLSSAHNQLFLIEEPENDLHPAALKALLHEIVRESEHNQFIISTHSNIVLAALGAIESTSVIEVRGDGEIPPTSTYARVEGPSERIRVLQDLGYELADFGLGEGWLIFEESSAEFLAKAWLIPAFAPGLSILKTVAATGTSRLRPMFRDIQEMFLFAHLQEVYRERVWIIADGDQAGRDATTQLREAYKTWPAEHFLNWEKDDFELYYPEVFADEAARVLAIGDGRAKMQAKGKLVRSVLNWVRSDEEKARVAFEKSAAEVIDKLRQIESRLLRSGETIPPTVSQLG